MSILWMMIVIALVAIGIAALRDPTELGDSLLFTLTALVLLWASVLAVMGRRPKRAYLMGFAVFGLGYLLLASATEIQPRLPTTHWLERLLPSILRLPPLYEEFGKLTSFELAYDEWLRGARDPRASLFSSSPYQDFLRIGHTLIALVLASLAGFVARQFALHTHVGRVEETTEKQVK
ncbi:MAG TPA: hypothetical protein VGZ22_11470 [Isosphaeraceae bacterium]|jgi:hypothetical protein|nr:hypothetical protein [Isosphaeraceae bacterium]